MDRPAVANIIAAMQQALPDVFAEAATGTVTILRDRRGGRGLHFVAREQLTRALVSVTVLYCGGNRQLAAKVLGVSNSTIKHYAGSTCHD